MKAGVTFSTAGHVAIVAWGLFAVAAPPPMEVSQVESIDVDVVPFDDFSKIVQGEAKAELKEKPALAPTKRPKSEPEAKNVGDTKNDEKSVRTVKSKPRPVEATKAETPPPAPVPKPKTRVEPVVKKVEPPAPAPTPEVAAKVEEKVPLTETPISETAKISEEGEQFAALPKTLVFTPQARPEAPKPQKAETTERKLSQKPVMEETASASTNDKKLPDKPDKIAALINKEEESASGAKASRQETALGSKKVSTNKKLSKSELDALKAAIEQCWSVPTGLPDIDEMRASASFNLKRDGTLVSRPNVDVWGGDGSQKRAFGGSVSRAIQRCAPYQLPSDKYEVWADIVVNFSASDMF